MGYMHIDNLYKDPRILLFRECYALEKIHGTSAHIKWSQSQISLFSGGASFESFKAIFIEEELIRRFIELGHEEVTVYGEAYGGKMQGMKATYGDKLRFVVFDVKIGETWLNVLNADDVSAKLGLEFVFWKKIPATPEAIDAERDADSVQAIRNLGIPGKMREGIVLRPLEEFRDHHGNRIITKHKRDDFKETASPREVNPDKLQVLQEAEAIALEWVTNMRLEHVLDKLPQGIGLESTRDVINAMIEDVLREANGEIVDSKDARKAIGSRAAALFKKRITKIN